MFLYAKSLFEIQFRSSPHRDISYDDILGRSLCDISSRPSGGIYVGLEAIEYARVKYMSSRFLETSPSVMKFHFSEN